MKVLIVEDEPRIASAIKSGLKQSLFVVDHASTGQEALDFATTETYDCIVLDWMLPDFSGTQVVSSLRHQQIHTPILMLTAKSLIDDKVEALNLGADDYLTKPFNFTELVARIHALARRQPQQQTNQLTYQDLTLDTNTLQVTRSGNHIHLTKKEYLLLEYLLRHPNQIISADRLTWEVWDFDSSVLSNTAQVYIGYLRNKIDTPFKSRPKLIHTVRGFGYKLGTA